MPGIFGGAVLGLRQSPQAVVDLMRQSLTHFPWYGSVQERRAGRTVGAVSTNPFFCRDNHWAEHADASLLIEGTAVTIDGTAIADKDPDLATRLLDAYLESGDGFVQRIGGHFNLVVLDHRDGRLQLMNDRMGFAHLYWYQDDEVFLFAPELKAFLAWEKFDRTLNESSFASLLARECPFGEDTLFSRVKMLAPASRLVLDQNGVTVHRYWRPEPNPESNCSKDDWLDEAEVLFRRSLDKRLPEDWPGRVVLPLSGGLDSRFLFWQSHSFGEQLEMFTHGQEDCTDARLARKIAAALGLENRHHLVKMNPDWAGKNGRRAVWLNDGQLNLRNATLIGISEELKPEPVPFLNGIIGACMSLGVGDFVGPDDMGRVTDEEELRRRVLNYCGVGPGSVYLPEMMNEGRAARLKEAAFDQVWRSFEDFDHVELFGDRKVLHINSHMGRRMQGTVDVHKYFFHDLLPFVDEELHALWLRIPLELRLDNGLFKELFRRRIEKLARVPWSHTGLNLFASDAENRAALQRRMKGLQRKATLRKFTFGLINPRNRDAYTHRETWLRKNREFRTLMVDTLGNVNATGCDWFDQKKINSMFQRFDKGRNYLFRPLMQVATVVLWHDLFLNQSHPAAGLQPLE